MLSPHKEITGLDYTSNKRDVKQSVKSKVCYIDNNAGQLGEDMALLFDINVSVDCKYVNTNMSKQLHKYLNGSLYPRTKYFSEWQIQSDLDFGFVPVSHLVLSEETHINPIHNDCLFQLHKRVNHTSAVQYPEDVPVYLSKELHHGAIIGPFENSPISGCHISPFMTCEKSNSNNRRVIIDLSWPHGHSANAGVDKTSYLNTSIHLNTVKICPKLPHQATNSINSHERPVAVEDWAFLLKMHWILP